MRRRIACSLILIIFACSFGVRGATPDPAGLTGTVTSLADDTPIAGARVHLGDPRTGTILSSKASGADGSFRLDDIPPGSWEIAVESADGLYLVASPIVLAPGKRQTVQLQVGRFEAAGFTAADLAAADGAASVWNKPTTAALLVIGSAVVAGFLIEAATNDNDEGLASP